MSRKWERMVAKNQKTLAQQNAKQPKEKKARAVLKSEQGIFEGRNVFVTVLCFSVAIMVFLFFGQVGESQLFFYVTVFLYFLFGFYFFFVKRPYIKVTPSSIAIKRFGKEKVTPAANIEKVLVQPGYVIITAQERRKHNIVFSKFFNRYDTDKLGEALREFAEKNKVEFVMEFK